MLYFSAMALSRTSSLLRLCPNILRTAIVVPKNIRVFSRYNNIGKYACLYRKRAELSEENNISNLTSYTLRDNASVKCTRIAKFSSNKPEEPNEAKPEEKLTLMQRYKKMLKEYWYVLIPVHLVTSTAWFGAFYYAAKSGIDIVPFLENLGVSEKVLSPLRSTSLGYIAIAYTMYKIATPARYVVTLGGTTAAIRYLSQIGFISSKNLTKMVKDRSDSVVKKFQSKS